MNLTPACRMSQILKEFQMKYYTDDDLLMVEELSVWK